MIDESMKNESLNNNLIYLASPYYHDSSFVRDLRYRMAAAATIKLMREHRIIYSPIVHNHPIACCGDLPKEWEYWNRIDTRMIVASDEIIVLKIAGWKQSVGVTAEIKIANDLRKPVSYLDVTQTEIIDVVGEKYMQLILDRE